MQENYYFKILVIDNDAVNIKLMAEILARENYLIQMAFDGQQALDNAKEYQPDLILLDIATPIYNGFELIRILKNMPVTKNIPIIITTTFDSESKEQALNAGADEFLNKPINSIELLARVRSMLRLKLYEEQLKIRKEVKFDFSKETIDKMSIGSEKFRSGYTDILLIGDLVNLKSIQNIFVNQQFIFSVAANEEKAMALAQSNQFDLIILDDFLPDINGLDLYQQIKRISAYQYTPVVFVTSISDHDYKIKCLESGADDFFLKPINNKEFEAKIQLLLKKKMYTDELHCHYQNAINSAINDGLTGLYKRSYFIACLDKEIKKSARNNSCLSVMMIDIDNFKIYNDTLGHLGGDSILREVGKVILNNVREIDLAARYGGEEFIVLLLNVDKASASIIAQRIQAGLSELPLPRELINIVNKLTVSIGIADYPCSSKLLSELLNKADLMLYQAKKTGKNKVCLYDDQFSN